MGSIDKELNIRMAVAHLRGAEEGFAPVMYSWLKPGVEDALMLQRFLHKPRESGLSMKLFISMHPCLRLRLCQLDYPTVGRAICEATALTIAFAVKLLLLQELNFTAGKTSTSEVCVQGGIWIQVAVYVFCGPILQTAIMGVTNLVLDIRPRLCK